MLDLILPVIYYISSVHCCRICGRWWIEYGNSKSWMIRYLLC